MTEVDADVTRLQVSGDAMLWSTHRTGNPGSRRLLDSLKGHILPSTGWDEFVMYAESLHGKGPVSAQGQSADFMTTWRIRQLGEQHVRNIVDAIDLVPNRRVRLDLTDGSDLHEAARLVITSAITHRHHFPMPEDWEHEPAIHGPRT